MTSRDKGWLYDVPVYFFFFYTIFPLFGPQGVNACLLKDQHMQNQMVRPCHNVSRMEQRSERLMPLRRNNPCPCPQCCPRWSPWLWQSAPTKTSSSGTLEAVAPVTATCTARLAGCCPTDTRWVWSTTAATPVTQTKVLTWIGHSWKMTYGLMCAFSRLSPDAVSVYSKVFWKGCLPGSQGNLCKVCMGGTSEAATRRCADNHNELYYGNMGALRYVCTVILCTWGMQQLSRELSQTPHIIARYAIRKSSYWNHLKWW